MSRRVKQKSTTNGLRYFQSLANVAVPGTLEEVPEEIEKKAEQIFGNDDWKSVENAIGDIFKNDSWLEESGILFKLHQNIKNILRSRTGTFLNDCYKEWLIKELNKEVLNLKGLKGVELLQRLKEKWTTFYSNTVPMLEVVFYLLKPKGRMSVRSTTLVTFRDVVFFSDNVEVSIRTEKEYASSELQHMILVLYSVTDTYPPSKNRLRLEAVAASLCSTFMGYYGMYKNGELVIPSNEPAAASRRRPSEVGPRRISRPFSVQPQQMETLNQLFKNAVRNKQHPRGGGRFQKNWKLV
ncbi:proline-rich protein 5-like [Parasteatoda tepidariorum]|uniref:proline-rich protein 5-like n=1 Tax=Parasteatoda tepidariorum TaxID=114398 RepID=UPI001C725BED|nr:proline-rich protein 5-like isoform X1 [Parasteatoda tepidariorum]